MGSPTPSHAIARAVSRLQLDDPEKGPRSGSLGDVAQPAGGDAASSDAREAKGSGSRFPEIDWIKGIGILTVILVHSLPTDFTGDKTSVPDRWLGSVTRYAVPGFLAGSGFLFAGSRSSLTLTAVHQRLQRLLPPYILFSLVTIGYDKVWQMVIGMENSQTPFVLKLLFGSALGPYYYVFMIVCLVIATPLVARIPRSALPWALAVSLALQLGCETYLIPPLPFFWQIRSPLRSLAPFLLGWLLRVHHEPLLTQVQTHRTVLVACASMLCAALAVVMLMPMSQPVLSGWEVAMAYAQLAIIFLATAGGDAPPEVVTWLSNASYTIYLSHFFFITPFMYCFPHQPGVFSPLRICAAWCVGLAGGASVVLLGRALLGEKLARQWLG